MSKKRVTQKKEASWKENVRRYGPWLALLLVLLLFASIRWRLREVVLERDEGEYAYAGQLLLQGVPPYQLAYNMKLPGTYAAYGFLMALFGQTTAGIHLGLLFVNAATSVLLFFIARKLFSAWAGAAAATAYAMLSASPSVVGLAAHANHFVVLMAVAGLFLLLKTEQNGSAKKLLGAGILLGLAFLMKQHGIFFGLFGGLWLVWDEVRNRPFDGKRCLKKIGVFSVGFLIPFLLTCLALWAAGVFEKFWFWTFTYARSYASAGNLKIGLERFGECLAEANLGNRALWASAILGFVLLWFERSWRRTAIFLSGWLLFSFISVWPGFVFRPHYFILMLPTLALLSGVVVQFGLNRLAKQGIGRVFGWLFPAFFIGAFGWTLFVHDYPFFRTTPQEYAIMAYVDNPFVESEVIARHIDQNAAKDARIAVVGSEPQIYFYARRLSATGYIYTYALMEPHPHAVEMQREMIREIETAKPEYLVFVGFPFSWGANPHSSRMIFEWFDQFAPRFYDKVGLIDYGIDSVWGPAAAQYAPKSENTISIFRRRAEGN